MAPRKILQLAINCFIALVIVSSMMIGGVSASNPAVSMPEQNAQSQYAIEDGGERTPASWWNPFSDDETVYDINTTMAMWLFGTGQPSHEEVFEESDLEDAEISNATTPEEVLERFTFEWDEPVELPEAWNENTFETYDSTRSTDEATHPSGIETIDDGRIREAHLTIHSISPSTEVHHHDRSELNIGEETTVRSTLDFYVAVPPDDYTEFPDSDTLISREWEYTLQQAVVTEYKLVNEDGHTVDSEYGATSTGSHLSKATLEGGFSGSGELTVEATIETEIEQVITTERWVEVSDGDGGTTTERRTSVEENDLLDSTTVEDSRTYTVQDLGEIESGVYHHPDGEIISTVTVDEPFAGYDMGDQLVRTGWGFYSQRDSDWDTREKIEYSREFGSTSTNTTTKNETAIPVRFNAYPSGRNPTIAVPDDIDERGTATVSADEELLETPEMDEELSVAHRDKYTEQKALRATHPTDVSEENSIVHGFVRGEESTHTPEVQTVAETNLTITNESRDTERDIPTEVTIEIRNNETDELVSHSESGGKIIVDDHPNNTAVDYGEDGEITINTNTSGTIEARYAPPDWTEVDEPLAEETAYSQVHSLPDRGTIRRWLVDFLIRITPVLLTIYVVNGLRQMFEVGGKRKNG